VRLRQPVRFQPGAPLDKSAIRTLMQEAEARAAVPSTQKANTASSSNRCQRSNARAGLLDRQRLRTVFDQRSEKITHDARFSLLIRVGLHFTVLIEAQ
jgi:hypothetical protein